MIFAKKNGGGSRDAAPRPSFRPQKKSKNEEGQSFKESFKNLDFGLRNW